VRIIHQEYKSLIVLSQIPKRDVLTIAGVIRES
jgi:hypothetical protein